MSLEQYHEEETLGKAYDSRLMKRLLSYALPYWKLFVVAFFVLVLITAADLARPYIMKIAIDDHLHGYSRPMVAVPVDELDPSLRDKAVIRGETAFVRVDRLPGYNRDATNSIPTQFQAHRVTQLRKVSGEHVLIEGLIHGDDWHLTGSRHQVTDGTTVFDASILDAAEVRQFRAHDVSAIKRLALLLFAVILISFLFNYGQIYLLNFLGQHIIYNIRMQLFSHLQSLDTSFFDRNPVGRLVTRVTNDTETLNEMYTNVLVNLFKDLLMLLGIVVVMFQLNVRLALVSLAVLPIIAVATVVFRIKARDAYRIVRTRLARVNATLAENIMGMRIIQIFHREKRSHDDFDTINASYLQAGLREIRIFAFFRPLIELIGSLALALLIWYGAGDVVQGTLQFGVLYAFINYIDQFFKPINDLTEKYNILQSSMASSERIFMLLDTEPKITDHPDAKPIDRLHGHIEFKNVWFAYNDEDWVLRDVSFEIKPGETVAFVGATGSGKTTILNLINRFYDIQRGQILVDGIDIKSYRQADLRKRVGMVLQDVFLFTGDIKTNLRLHHTHISDEQIRAIAKEVNADRFISRLPAQYDEPVKERGATLSAGQRQLLAFARALVFDPDILILDEATANIDTETEQLIQDALKRLITGRTTIVVAHRLSTIQHSDRIILMHRGKIREMGTHQELLDVGGLYYHLYRLQYKDEFEDLEGKVV